jgi:D-glycero-D-manno-heptose 1,7-bisphosphate phosphatase
MLDRDGTLIVERHYLSAPAQVELLPGAAAGLRALRALGFGLVVVTNQSGLSRGYFDLPRLEQIHARLAELLAEEDIHLDGIYVCPHLPEHACGCRKPRPGLVNRAALEHGFDPRRGMVVGDKACDVELGHAVGALSVLVRTGYGAHVNAEGLATPDVVVDDLRGLASLATSVRALAA